MAVMIPGLVSSTALNLLVLPPLHGRFARRAEAHGDAGAQISP
jgi:Cu/Ag efflux pump CusA